MAYDGSEVRLALAALAGLAGAWLLLGAPGGRGARIALAAAVVVGGLLYFVTSRPPWWIHRHDLFHTATTARWIEPLGYTDLYDCTYTIDAPRLPHIERIRDLRTLEVVPARPRADCFDRFTAAELARFRADLDFWHDAEPGTGPIWWRTLLQDKGYNGTPLHLALARAFFGRGDLSLARLQLAGAIDVLLLLAAFALLWRTRGGELAGLAFLYFCTAFPNHFSHMGGSFLRYDWFAASLAGLCLLPRRPGLAGAAIGFAAAERIFPAFFAAGLAIRAGRQFWRTRRLEARYLWFAGAFLVTAGAGVLVGALASGVSWTEFAADLAAHSARGGTFRIGLPELVAPTAAWLLAAALLAGTIALVDDLDDAGFAALFGVVALFALLAATRYYHAAFALLFLVDLDHRRERTWAVALALLFWASVATTAVWLLTGSAALTYQQAASAAALAVLAWILGSSIARRRRASVIAR